MTLVHLSTCQTPEVVVDLGVVANGETVPGVPQAAIHVAHRRIKLVLRYTHDSVLLQMEMIRCRRG